MNSYSLTSDSSRWWLPSAAAGAAATVAVVAIVGSSSAGNAIPIEPNRSSSVSTPVQASLDIPPGWRYCFMEQPHWHDVAVGPQPICRIDPGKTQKHDEHQGQSPTRPGPDQRAPAPVTVRSRQPPFSGRRPPGC